MSSWTNQLFPASTCVFLLLTFVQSDRDQFSDNSGHDQMSESRNFEGTEQQSQGAIWHNGKNKVKWKNRNDGANSILKFINADELSFKTTNTFQHMGTDASEVVEVNVNICEVKSKLPHFWESTGLCPPAPHEEACQWLTGEDMIQNLAYIGAIPHNGISNIRAHFLLDTVTVESFSSGRPVYNFTCLDQFIWLLYKNGLHPGFEVMGNPSNLFSDFENRTQIYMWRDLVQQLSERYIDIYGLAYVMKWNFESWNEPKVKIFDGLNFTYQGFLNYYDASSEGLRLANAHLKFGGPSGGCKNFYDIKQFCWVLLDHLNNGINYFTGLKNTRVDFLSIHEKGEGPNNSEVILFKEQSFHALLKKHQPNLTNIPVYNDEGDPLVTWSKALVWRANSVYSSMVAKVISMHQNTYIANKTSAMNFQLLSNDNGFLSYQPLPFHQRTLLARFQVNKTREPFVQFIQKPVYSMMGLLSLLGEYQLTVRSDHPYIESDIVNVLSSLHEPADDLQDSWQMAALVYYSTDTDMEHKQYKDQLIIKLNITDIPVKQKQLTDLCYVIYGLDESHGNPYNIWKSNGSPSTPSVKLFKRMRESQAPVRITGPRLLQQKQTITMNYTLPRFGVVLLHVCARAELPPDQVGGLTVHNITLNQVLITWSDSCVNTKCLLRYDVEFSSSGVLATYNKINMEDSIFTVFVYQPINEDDDEAVRGYYRVRAVDYWSRPGEYSVPLHY